MDKISKEQRSRNMAAIRSKGNQTTEVVFLKLLRTNKITGWRRHVRHVVGVPDFVFPKHKLAIFIDGCFWHGCRKCKTHPKTNIRYWETKITNNQKRDKAVKKRLVREGWKVFRFWEHEIN
jgi:DNA mismatch endonuclease (patch repair protein)